jgi:hypothetical protein
MSGMKVQTYVELTLDWTGEIERADSETNTRAHISVDLGAVTFDAPRFAGGEPAERFTLELTPEQRALVQRVFASEVIREIMEERL